LLLHNNWQYLTAAATNQQKGLAANVAIDAAQAPGGDMSIGWYNTAGGSPLYITMAEAIRLLLLQLPLATYCACSGTLLPNRFPSAPYGGCGNQDARQQTQHSIHYLLV